MRALVTVPFVLPTVVVGAAFSRILPHRFDHTVWAILIAHVFFNYAVVVRVVGGLWANLDPRLAESASSAGRAAVAVDARDRPAAARSCHRGRGRDRVPVHVHLVRRRAAPRWATPLDARGRDLPTDRAAARPPGGSRARAGSARRGGRVAARHHADAVTARRATTDAPPRRDEHHRAHARPTRGPRSQLRRDARAPRAPVAGARRAIVRGSRRTRPDVVSPARIDGHERPLRATDRGDPELAGVRGDRDRDRHRDRRIGLDRDRRTAHARLVRRRPDAAARRLGGDDRLRLPHHARPAPARPAREGDPDPDRAGTRRPSLRRALGRARAPIDRRPLARGRGSARRVAEPHLA